MSTRRTPVAEGAICVLFMGTWLCASGCGGQTYGGPADGTGGASSQVDAATGGSGGANGTTGGDIGKVCRLNSDCRQPLVCIAALCHVQCVETRDCPAGQRCVVTSDGNVCQLQSESHCVRNSDCISPLVCARDLACRYPCTADRDCLAMQVCAKSGVCADRNELDSNGDLPAR